MTVAPGVYSRNRMFAFYKDPHVRQAKGAPRSCVASFASAGGRQWRRRFVTLSRGARGSCLLRYRIAQRASGAVARAQLARGRLRVLPRRARGCPGSECRPPRIARSSRPRFADWRAIWSSPRQPSSCETQETLRLVFRRDHRARISARSRWWSGPATGTRGRSSARITPTGLSIQCSCSPRCRASSPSPEHALGHPRPSLAAGRGGRGAHRAPTDDPGKDAPGTTKVRPHRGAPIDRWKRPYFPEGTSHNEPHCSISSRARGGCWRAPRAPPTPRASRFKRWG